MQIQSGKIGRKVMMATLFLNKKYIWFNQKCTEMQKNKQEQVQYTIQAILGAV